jgi:hypothetical protein
MAQHYQNQATKRGLGNTKKKMGITKTNPETNFQASRPVAETVTAFEAEEYNRKAFAIAHLIYAPGRQTYQK